jgi:hypothetical protein
VANFDTSFTTTSETLSVDDIYDLCLYKPTSDISDSGPIRHTLEALNGGLTVHNLSTASPFFTSDVFRAGSFARGYFYGFNFPDRFHSAQFGADSNHTLNFDVEPRGRFYTPHYSLGANIFMPWRGVVYITYQGFFSGTATRFGSNKSGEDVRHQYIGEYWKVRFEVDGDSLPGMTSVLPATRANSDLASVQHRWRWHHRVQVVSLDKGYHNISALVWPMMLGKDNTKMQTLCGSISVLALKSGKPRDAAELGVPEWYSQQINESKEANDFDISSN